MQIAPRSWHARLARCPFLIFARRSDNGDKNGEDVKEAAGSMVLLNRVNRRSPLDMLLDRLTNWRFRNCIEKEWVPKGHAKNRWMGLLFPPYYAGRHWNEASLCFAPDPGNTFDGLDQAANCRTWRENEIGHVQTDNDQAPDSEWNVSRIAYKYNYSADSKGRTASVVNPDNPCMQLAVLAMVSIFLHLAGNANLS
ncbi:hypothetical protein BJV78DRAFT_1155850 [Lactifluus subvellereus]|nr:hypothetical protein BJV78DRAFT_1155850 [Lactifluus subvellereus]